MKKLVLITLFGILFFGSLGFSENVFAAVDFGDLIIAQPTPPTIFKQNPSGGPPSVLFSGAPYVGPQGIAFEPSTGDIVVVDPMGSHGVFRQNPNGLAPSTIFSGAPYVWPIGVVIEPSTGDIIVADSGSNPSIPNTGTIFRQNPSGGPPSVIFSGAPYVDPRYLVIEPSTGDIIVTDDGAHAVFRQNPSGGPPSVIFSGAPYVRPMGVDVELSTGDIIVVDFLGHVFRQNPSGGPPSVIFSGAPYVNPVGIGIDSFTGNILVVEGDVPGGIFVQNPSGGSPSTIFYGSPYNDPFDLDFYNFNSTTIKIIKNTTNADGAFDFTINSTDATSYHLITIPNTATNNMTTPLPISPGTYNVTEIVPSGWTLVSSDCERNGVSLGTIFNVTAGDSIECIFENIFNVTSSNSTTIKIIKNTTNADGAFDFTITNSTGILNSTISIPDTSVNNISASFPIRPDNYTVAEIIPSGWTLVSSDCERNGVSLGTTVNFPVFRGDSIECIFENLFNNSTNVDIEVRKFVSNTLLEEGDTSSFTIRVENLGPDTATGVKIYDLLPSGVTFISTTNSGGNTYASSIWDVGTLNSGDAAKLQINFSVNSGTECNTITNGASVSSVDQTDTNPNNDKSSVSFDVKCIPPLPEFVVDEEIITKDLHFGMPIKEYTAIKTPPQHTFLKQISCHIEDSDEWKHEGKSKIDVWVVGSSGDLLVKSFSCKDRSPTSKFIEPMVYLPPNSEVKVKAYDGGFFAVDIWLQILVDQDVEKFDGKQSNKSSVKSISTDYVPWIVSSGVIIATIVGSAFVITRNKK